MSSGDDFDDDVSAECMDEYSVDSDGNIKPGQDVPKLSKGSMINTNSEPKKSDKPEQTLEEKRT